MIVRDLLISESENKAIPVWALKKADLETWKGEHAGARAHWAETQRFEAEEGRVLMLPADDGGIAGVLLGLGDGGDPFAFGALTQALPLGDYRICEFSGADPYLAALSWVLGAYRFTRYAGKVKEFPRLVLPEGVKKADVLRDAGAVFLVRDLVNTPAGDLGPAELEEAARQLAKAHGAKIDVITGDALLGANYPMVHAVGRAAGAGAEPRLIDIRWGNPEGRKVTLVGKGVCFDTGGLNLKPGNSMGLMKKDMGGAAHVLALGQMIMERGLDICLRILVPAVENAVAGNAFRPGDVLQSRKGLTVEIGNTDAEGRLILADALAEADGEAPELLIDMATLTGAARVALGPDLPPYYTKDEAFAGELQALAKAHADPMWRLPLWGPYDKWLDSQIADVNHITENGFAGSVTAALFLSRFVEKAKTYVHFDIYAWNPAAKPGRPLGGAAQTIRALDRYIARHFG
ncbi:leucyl aminopeptidase family protein [Tepidicaulis marinus]|uniref:leucyl aminopeptidase family protein n=1 Tax=Tepidicaulis marinus TaxID=1333998 RepID=UPI000694B448|nr:leucyl aminopeptidase family protein [Tepidicaulis marinus]